jgi:hypothetical protein
VRHLQDLNIGLVGPTTNRLGNEAEIETCYRTYGEFEEFAASVGKRGEAELFDIGIGSMFCLALRRKALDQLGPIDEQFGIGSLRTMITPCVRAGAARGVCGEYVRPLAGRL